MKRQSLFLTLAAGMLVWGFGTLETRAGNVPLPTTLDQLLIPGNFTTVAASNETDTFSNFAYSTSPVGSPPTAANITVHPFSAGLEAGLSFSGAFFAAAGTTVDYSFFFTATAPVGSVINDATLSGVFSTFDGTGVGSIGETVLNAANGVALGTMEISSSGATSQSINFAGVNSVIIEKDLILVGGSRGTAISIFNDGVSSSGAIPEPHSLALLAIGMGSIFTVRRFFKKRTAVA